MVAITRVRRGLLALPLLGLLVSTATLATPAGAASAATPRQYGLNVYVTDTCARPASDWQTLATNEMKGVKSLGANSVALAFGFYTTDINSNSVFTANWCTAASTPSETGLGPRTGPGPYMPVYNSPSPARLGVLVKTAHKAGLRVVLRPLLNEAHLTKWRGAIAPTNVKAWFTSYESVLRPYLRMAQNNKVEQFAISGELNSLQNSPYWPSVIKFARHLYSGKLLVTPTWPLGPTRHAAGTTFGVDAYPNFSHAPSSASVAQLLAGWNGALRATSLPAGATLYEVGINAVDGAYTFPSVFHNGVFDQQIQVNWFTTACQFVKSHKLGGIYFWGSWLESNSGNLLSQPNPNAAAELQPASQTAIRACFKH